MDHQSGPSLRAHVEEILEHSKRIPEEYPYNLTDPEDIEVEYDAMYPLYGDILLLYNHLNGILWAQVGTDFPITDRETASKYIQDIEHYAQRLDGYVKELHKMKRKEQWIQKN